MVPVERMPGDVLRALAIDPQPEPNEAHGYNRGLHEAFTAPPTDGALPPRSLP
jgi:hypothetical protein